MPVKQKTSKSVEKTFRASIELSFINITTKNGSKTRQTTTINANRIMYLMFNYQYFEKTCPMAVIYLQVPTKLYKKLIDRQKYAKIKIKIKGRNPLAKHDIPKTYMEHTFDYITVNQNQPYGIPSDDIADEDKYRGIYLGLVDDNMTKYIRTPFNGIYHNTSLSALLAIGLAGWKDKYVIEPFKYNYKYNQIFVPACSTRKKYLEFLYDYDQFYDDDFNFFVDYDKVYMLSQSGNGGSGSPISDRNLIIDIRPITDDKSYKDGYNIQDNAYYLYMNQMDVSVNVNTAIDQLANKVISYGDRRDSKSYDLSDGERVIFARSDDPANEEKAKIESATTVIELAKNNIPDNIFDPARVITVKMYKDYKQYSGKYKLYYKRVIYKVEDSEFLVNVNVGLIPAEETLTPKQNTSLDTNRAVSGTAYTHSSSDEQSTGGNISRSEYVTNEREEEESLVR